MDKCCTLFWYSQTIEYSDSRYTDIIFTIDPSLWTTANFSIICNSIRPMLEKGQRGIDPCYIAESRCFSISYLHGRCDSSHYLRYNTTNTYSTHVEPIRYWHCMSRFSRPAISKCLMDCTDSRDCSSISDPSWAPPSALADMPNHRKDWQGRSSEQ